MELLRLLLRQGRPGRQMWVKLVKFRCRQVFVDLYRLERKFLQVLELAHQSMIIVDLMLSQV